MKDRGTKKNYITAEPDEEFIAEMKSNHKSSTPVDLLAPFQKANIISRLTFSWVSALFKLGHKRPVTMQDLNYLPKKCYASNTSCKFKEHWNKNEKSVSGGLLAESTENAMDDSESTTRGLLGSLLGITICLSAYSVYETMEVPKFGNI